MINKCAALTALAAIAASGSACAAVTISTTATQNMNCSGGTCTPTAPKAQLNANDLENYLTQFGNVRVVTTGNGVEANNIVVDVAFASPNSTSLTLDAHGAITINAAVSIGSATSELELQSGTGATLGNLSFGPNGSIQFGSVSDIFGINGAIFQLEASLPELAAAANSAPSGFYALANSYNARADGTYRSPPINASFSGYFEALGNTISNLMIKTDTVEYIGLFAHLVGNQGFGTVRNLRLVNATVTSDHPSDIGGIAGYGEQGSMISQSSVTGEVRSGDSSSAGGVAGSINFGTVSSSWSSARVVAGDIFSNVGGLVGTFGSGALRNSYATGAVTGGTNSSTGGLAGTNASTISDSFSTGAVHGDSQSSAGGLIGSNGGSVKDSYAEGDVSVENGGGALGGLVGYDEHGAVASYSTGKVTGTSGLIGGVVGFDCSRPRGDDCATGGYRDTYWNTTTSALKHGAGNVRKDKWLQGISSPKLRSGLPEGFSDRVWTEQGTTNQGFPYLINNPPPR